MRRTERCRRSATVRRKTRRIRRLETGRRAGTGVRSTKRKGLLPVLLTERRRTETGTRTRTG